MAVVLKLTITEGPDAGKVIHVPMNEPQLIGRSSEALPISDTTVSRRHAELTPDGGIWYLKDLRSQNNTYLNGKRITDRVELSEGDEIRVGSTVIRVGEIDRDQHLDAVQLVHDGRLESAVEHRLSSNEDSVILAEPEPGRAAVDHLRVIYQLTSLTAQLTDKQRLLEQVMDLVFNELDPQRGTIMLVEKHKKFQSQSMDQPGHKPDPKDLMTEAIPLVGPDLVPAVVKYAQPPTDEDEATIQVSRSILYHTIREGEGILSSNAQADPRFSSGDSVERYNIRSAICSPIKFGDRTFGAVYIDSSIANYTFTTEQLALMNAIGQHTALAIANAEQTARRLQTERLAAIGETVASLSHSIKNILQGLRGGADVVEMALQKDDLKIAAGGWDILKRNLDRIVALTMNMLTFSRRRRVELELTKFGGLIDDCVELLEKLAEDKGVLLIVDYDKEMPPVPIDPDLMHQALMNLLTNAIEAAPAKEGVVTVRVFYHEPGPERPSLQFPLTEIAIVDNGEGIDPDKLQWIFEPFNTTKGIRGTGLGLAVTRRIVQDHRGKIRVESKPGKGATFRIVIPANLDEADPSATAQSRSGATRFA
ncbi:MAG: ATP-binding protein [Planctomycetota bacterium]